MKSFYMLYNVIMEIHVILHLEIFICSVDSALAYCACDLVSNSALS